MPRFELQKLTSYDDQSLIAELHRVAGLIPTGSLKSSDFDKLAKVHSSTLRVRFGNWSKALTAAGLASRFDSTSEPYSREEIIEHLKTIAACTGRKFVTTRELYDQAGITAKPIRRLFGSLKNALEAAGLSQSPLGLRYTDEECFENILNVWTAHGRQPFYSEIKKFPSRVGSKAYILRWGSWRKALTAFVERVNVDAVEPVIIKPDGKASVARMNSDEAEPSEDLSLEKITESKTPKIDSESGKSEEKIIKPEDRRGINLSLRYKVLSRDNFKCVRCGRSPATCLGIVLHVDHKNPFSKTGKTTLENLETKCSDCNIGKGNRHIE